MYVPTYIAWLLLVASQTFLVVSTSRRPLNKFIHHYEPLNYAEDAVKGSFNNGVGVKSLNFKAHGRDFWLRLEQDRDTFAPHMTDLTKEAADVVHSAVAGYLEGEKNSEAFGTLKDGKFDGTIFTGDDQFIVKPSKHYFDKPQNFHSVIYRSKDVDSGNLRYSNDLLSRVSNDFHAKRRHRRESPDLDVPDTFKLYDHEDEKNLRVCNVSMEADYLFTEALGDDPGRAVGELIYLIRVANRKFEEMAKSEIWGKNYTVRLMLGRVMAYTYETTPKELQPRSMGVSTFLDHVSDRNYDGFCQAFFFTYRDFEGGITGLSWSKYGKERGGICEPRRYFVKITENYHVQKLKSYNTGVVTYKFFGTFIPPKVGEIAFLRQIGTAFGAPDDPDTAECRPGLLDGNYIMFDKATNGGRKNNDKFSNCSIRAIVKTLNSPQVLDRIINSDRILKIYCMELPKAIIERRPKCGDSVVHFYEQCDCGTEEECRIKEPGRCCTRNCTLRPGASCTVNDGPCCDTTTCSHRDASYICRPGDECSFPARCANLRGFDNYQCPARVKKGDYKPCAVEAQVCMDGVCSNSVCRRYGLKECQCSQKEVQCFVCCMFLGKCVAARDIPVVTGFRKPTLPIGAPCNNNTGYCDLFHVCQPVELQTYLDRISNLYYRREDVKTITLKYWWAILLGTAAWIGVIVLLVFCLNKRAKSSIPKRDPRNIQMSNLLPSS